VRAGVAARRFDPSRLSYTVAKRDAAGELATRCVTGADAAAKALGSTATVEARHDH
jgi:hypothetical protein